MELFDGIVSDATAYANYGDAKARGADSTYRSKQVLSKDQNEPAELMYLLLRSMITIGLHASDRTLERQESWRKLCSLGVKELSLRPGFLERPPLPTWAIECVDQVRQQLRPSFPQIDQIRVTASLEPRLYVRSYHEANEIRISLLIREVLRTMNLAVCNTMAPNPGMAQSEADGRVIPVDLYLPYLLPLYWDIRWSRVPSMRASSEFAAQLALHCTRLQMTFMVAHEFAHLLLHDAGRSGSALEVEADKFAYDVLFRHPGEGMSVGDVWMSTRWLFEILTLERTLSWRLADNDATPPMAQHRRETLLFPFARSVGPSMIDVLLGGRGLKVLVNTNLALAGSSASSLREHAHHFQELMMAE